MADKIRAGIVGLGGYASAIAKAASTTGNLDITHCFTRTESKRVEFSEAFGAEPCGSYDELLEADLDAVILTTPNFVHTEQTEIAGVMTE